MKRRAHVLNPVKERFEQLQAFSWLSTKLPLRKQEIIIFQIKSFQINSCDSKRNEESRPNRNKQSMCQLESLQNL